MAGRIKAGMIGKRIAEGPSLTICRSAMGCRHSIIVDLQAVA
jgi:hypothetical protein